MTDLLVDVFHFEWVDVFVLAGKEHGGDATNVQRRNFKCLCALLEVSVKTRDCAEKRLVVTSEVGHDFDHPVHHARPEHRRNFMLEQAVFSGVSLFLLSEVPVDVFTKVQLHMKNFSFDLS